MDVFSESTRKVLKSTPFARFLVSRGDFIEFSEISGKSDLNFIGENKKSNLSWILPTNLSPYSNLEFRQ